MHRTPLLLLAATLLCSAQDFKFYPAAKHDDKATKESSAAAPGKQSEVYTTTDPLDKVYAFYKAAYKETSLRSSTGPKLPTGEQVKWYFFIIDSGTTLANSKHWMKIQRPYVGGADMKDIRDLTVIQVVTSK